MNDTKMTGNIYEGMIRPPIVKEAYYVVIAKPRKSELEDSVNFALNNRYELVGGVSYGEGMYLQAVIKRSKR